MINTRTTKKELHRIFQASVDLADLIEDLLERSGDFSPEFLSGLHRSIKEAASGKTRRIESLKNLA
jgi:hypothetical protein